MNQEDSGLLLRAADFAARKHQDQRRKWGNIPYINHPLGVAHLLCGRGRVQDPTTLAGALLHDTIEDTATTRAELEKEFGTRIAGVVAEVSDDKRLPKEQRKRLQVEKAGKLSGPARLIKLADKLYNLHDLVATPPPAWDLVRIRGYFLWAHQVLQNVGPRNPPLWDELTELLAGEFHYQDQAHPILPPPGERETLLEEYYRCLN